MYLNPFAQTEGPLDLSTSAETDRLRNIAWSLGTVPPSHVRVHSRNVVLNGVRLHLMEWGEPAAPTVVVVHGGNQSLHTWDLVSLALSADFRVIALDQRGHGDSEWPRDGASTMDDLAEDLVALLKRLDVRDPLLVGNGLGGMVCLEAAARMRSGIGKLVMVDVGPTMERSGVQRIRSFTGGEWEFDSLDQYVAKVVAFDPWRDPKSVRETARYNLLLRADGKYARKHDRRFPAGRRTESSATWAQLCAAVAVPVLIVRGRDSRVFSDGAAAELADAFPDAQVLVISQAGHNVQSQQPALLVDAIRSFWGAAAGG